MLILKYFFNRLDYISITFCVISVINCFPSGAVVSICLANNLFWADVSGKTTMESSIVQPRLARITYGFIYGQGGSHLMMTTMIKMIKMTATLTTAKMTLTAGGPGAQPIRTSQPIRAEKKCGLAQQRREVRGRGTEGLTRKHQHTDTLVDSHALTKTCVALFILLCSVGQR